ncbi:MAG: M4 family metallopeptidase [Saprospiraceae bacterium]
MRSAILFIVLFCLPVLIDAQSISKVSPLVFYPHKTVNFVNFFDEYKTDLGLTDESKMILENRGFSKFTADHKKYHQYYKNIPVFGHSMTLHSVAGKIHHATGSIAKNIAVDVEQIKTVEEVFQSLIPSFLQDIDGGISHKKDVELISNQTIIIDRFFPSQSGKYCLAFDLHLSNDELGKMEQFIVDAKTGGVIFHQNLVCNLNPKGVAPSYHYGDVDIDTEQVEPNKYVLRDVTRGNGNTTFLNTVTGDILLSDDDNNWEKPDNVKLGQVAYDAHYCTMKFYDFLINRFNYSGIDGNGRSMIARANINNGADLVNAFWNNQNASFGNGNCHYHPLTTLSIVGHEFAHGITSDNAKLIYSGESGGLNESFSDIIGKALEYMEDSTDFNWEVGHEIVATRFAKPFRSMLDPNVYNNPKMYKGKHWRDGGSVHSNSGVLNHWFYLMVEGGSGKNELDTSYLVNPVAIQNVLDIVFLCQRSYLQPTSTYPDMFEYSKLACESLFGKNSPQYQSLIEAWKAVGLPYIGIPIENFDDLVLTAKIKNDPNNFYTCYKGQHPEINVFISNKGTIVYPKGHILKMNIIRNGLTIEKDLVLPEALPPDSIRMIAIPEYVVIDKTEFYSLEMNLLHNDHVQSNNRFYLYFQNYATSGVDLQISGISHKEVDCFTNDLVFTIRVRNNSCFTSPKGETITVDVINKDNNTVYPFSRTTEIALAPRNEAQITATIPYDWQSINFAYKMLANIDSDTTNNSSLYTVVEKGVVESSKKYTFSDSSFDEDFKHNSPQSRFLFEEEYYFRTKTNFSTNNAPCLGKEDNFKNVNGGLAQFTVAETCLDVSGFMKPLLRFNMRQFRSNYYSTFPELEGNSTILKLEFISEGNSFYPEPIKNQSVGESNFYEYFLPQGFKGVFRLVAFTSRHDGTSAINDKNDVILLDNIELSDVVANEDLTNDQLIRVYPNPAGDFVTISNENRDIVSIELLDIAGRQLASYQFLSGVGEFLLNTRELINGCYLLEIGTSNKTHTIKVIK